MALVSYSDSETSDTETTVAPQAATFHNPSGSAKPAVFQKTEARKIKVDLPSLRPEVAEQDIDGPQQPPVKRARTAGAFEGFNSLLPAPKKPATQQPTGLKKGVSLKTSSEAAFSRVPPPRTEYAQDALQDDDYDDYGNRAPSLPQRTQTPAVTGGEAPDVKVLGRATRFKPLSVANNKKKKVVPKKAVPIPQELADEQLGTGGRALVSGQAPGEPLARAPPSKKSLFSIAQDDDMPSDAVTESYGATNGIQIEGLDEQQHSVPHEIRSPFTTELAPNSLEAVAADLNLTPAQRRQLFGRSAKNVPANATHFNMDAEYAANEEIRQSGETLEHKAVKTVAPGKHSLQQLVNNARSNQESIEDKWAEGRRNRGEGGSKYGWGHG
ncbi:hypothetical protein BAUCODRAFT_384610 [Baudoinia panamericana UAMH 10762]|uniref:Uncharacterized protein n=1 Tax=Baudoinia panamericana (strain UAMH 10762) TaxID=717646 RepID=M2N4K9_BAUPA|nr:uncharacterized protein BAUCODRAFT_384610 [Baudoinia panamericana UAMH 10762]EMC98918.1 hypothetical protein BAUCODRAFT_384610 [Baudoinia panamericana UAMH 10762]